MKLNSRVPVANRRDRQDGFQPSMTWPVVISMLCHAVFMALFVISPSLRTKPPKMRSVINVSMVSLKSADNPAAAKSQAAPKASPAKTPDTPKPADTDTPKARIQPPVKQPPAVDQEPPKTKTSLKTKTFKSTRVVKQAIQQLEQKVAEKPEPKAAAEEASRETLKSALDRLRQKVDRTQADQQQAVGTGSGASLGGATGKINEAGGRQAELIDLYRIEVAFEIQKNWAFNEQLAGGDQSLVSAIVFKVMPNGEIRDIWFTDRSGNTYLDDSAYKAIVKSDPVDPHPPGLNLPYVEMGVRFTPQGMR